MKSKILLIIILLLGLVVGFLLAKMTLPAKVITKVSNKVQYNESVDLTFEIKGTSIFTGAGQITVGDKGESSRPSLSLSEETYPSLFLNPQGKKADQISLESITDTKNKNEYAVFVRGRFSAGSFDPAHIIIVNLTTRKVIYESPKHYVATRASGYTFNENGSEVTLSWNPYYFYSSVTNDMLPVIEYVGFDPTSGMFKLVNTSHKQAFVDLLKQYDIYETKCSYHGQKMNVSDIVKKYGGDKKCDDNLIPGKPKYDPDGFITVGQFEKIRENIKKIINGENIPLIDD